jgi:23S rRNA (uridine2552-2'-O)-methyltransferase
MTEEEPPRKRMVKPPAGGTDAGRTKPARLKKTYGRTTSQQAWLERQINDPFSAKKGARVIDLGCAPGGWLQIAVERGVTQLVGVDLLPVDPVEPAHILEMDFTDDACPPKLIELLGGAPDVVLSDMAPNTVGHRETDHLRIVGLIEMGAEFAIEVLKPGGAFVAKAFQGGETADVIARLKKNFDKVVHYKPKASRADSSEVFLVATGFRGR